MKAGFDTCNQEIFKAEHSVVNRAGASSVKSDGCNAGMASAELPRSLSLPAPWASINSLGRGAL